MQPARSKVSDRSIEGQDDREACKAHKKENLPRVCARLCDGGWGPDADGEQLQVHCAVREMSGAPRAGREVLPAGFEHNGTKVQSMAVRKKFHVCGQAGKASSMAIIQ